MIEKVVVMRGEQGYENIPIPSNFTQQYKYLTIWNLTDNSVAIYPPGVSSPTAGLSLVVLGFYSVVTVPITPEMQNGFSLVWTNPNGTNLDKAKTVRLIFSEENLNFNQSFAPSFSMGGNVVNTAVVAPLPAGTAKIGQVDVASLPSLPNGSNKIGQVDVASLPPLPAGNNNIGNVGVTSLPAPPYQDLTIQPSTTVTTNGQSADLTVGGYRELTLFVNVTNVTGTSPTLNIVLLSKDPVSGVYAPIDTSMPQITAPGMYTLSKSGGLGSIIAVGWTVGGTSPSFEFSVGGVLK